MLRALLVTWLAACYDCAAAAIIAGTSPFMQNLPDCRTNPHPTVRKRNNIKAITCPMVKDETGFLSEWVAYHVMHGIDHIRFYDDTSARNDTFAEVEPWIRAGVVSVIPARIASGLDFNGMIKAKDRLEAQCKDFAFENKYDLFFSLDLDEYLVPSILNNTAVDELWEAFDGSGQLAATLGKYNFNAMPHILEPVNLLTIEAYQSKMARMNQMTYFKRVGPKLVIRISGPHYEHENRSDMIRLVKKCGYHGCNEQKALVSLPNQQLFLYGPSPRKFPIPAIYHYGRSLEKFALKTETWRTASGEGGNKYDLTHFMDRCLGSVLDMRATVFGCQVREILRSMTGEPVYFRPGDFWYRNAEFGLALLHPLKGKRNAFWTRNFVEATGKVIPSPYHYFGDGYGTV